MFRVQGPLSHMAIYEPLHDVGFWIVVGAMTLPARLINIVPPEFLSILSPEFLLRWMPNQFDHVC
jgi:hypothetical protein